MAETTKLSKEIQKAVQGVFDKQDEKGVKRHWNQPAHAFANALAAQRWFTNKDLAPDLSGFIAAHAEYGFLGNASQFRQSLGKLPEDDPLYLKDEGKGKLDLYA